MSDHGTGGDTPAPGAVAGRLGRDDDHHDEAWYRALVAEGSDMILVLDAQGRTMWHSPSFRRLLGWEPGDPDAHPGFHPDDAAPTRSALRRALARPGERITLSFRAQHADGSWHHFDATLVNHLDDPAIDGIVVNARDVTDRAVAQAALASRERRFRAILQRSSDAYLLVGPDGVIREASPSVRTIAGRSPDDFVGRPVWDLVDPTAASLVQGRLPQRVGLAGAHPSQVYPVRHADGSRRWVETRTTNLLDDPAVRALVVNLHDVTEQVEARQEAEQLHAVIDASADVVIVFAPGEPVHYANHTATLMGFTPDLTAPQAPFDAASRRALLDIAVPAALSAGAWEGELTLEPEDGLRLAVSGLLTAHPGPDGGVAYLSLVARDISAHKAIEAHLEHLALHDPLTGLANRALFTRALDAALARSARDEHHRVALLFVDLDRFKEVNDTFGHDVGDTILQAAARRLSAQVRAGDLAARLGGDELVVLCEPVDGPGAAAGVATRVLVSLGAPVSTTAGDLRCTASIGVAVAERGESRRSLLRRADAALYEAKAGGRAQLRLAREPVPAR